MKNKKPTNEEKARYGFPIGRGKDSMVAEQ